MKILCVIPSRIGSERLPRKPLLPLNGKPMIQWVYENAKKSPIISNVIVATDSEEIAKVVRNIGGEVFISDSPFETGSDRVAAVAAFYPEMEVIINLQGDEPFVTAPMLAELIAPYLQHRAPDMTTLARPLNMDTHYSEPSTVKVITDMAGNALYFSRSPIPYLENKTLEVPVYHHIGLYAFRREFLQLYTKLPRTPLEQAERLEQLRALEHGYRIQVCITQNKTLEINTHEEYELAKQFVNLE